MLTCFIPPLFVPNQPRTVAQPQVQYRVVAVEGAFLTGALLAIMIVWLFLGNFRSTIITAVALPNALLGAFVLVKMANFSINTMTLLSLSLSVGLLIDDSIVVRENIFRYVEHGMKPKDAAEKGTNEVALAVLSTTLSIMAVFIPISFLSGVIGQFFREFGLTIAFALLISLVDAFTTAPMLSAYWYKATDRTNAKGISRFFNNLSDKWNEVYDKINALYLNILKWSLGHKKMILAGTLGLFVFSIFAFSFVGKNFMSNSDNGMISISLETYPGAPLDVVDSYVKKIEEYVGKKKDVETYYSQIGQNGSHLAGITVIMVELKKRKVKTSEMIDDLRKFCFKNFGKDLTIRVSEQNYFTTGGGGGGRDRRFDNRPAPPAPPRPPGSPATGSRRGRARGRSRAW